MTTENRISTTVKEFLDAIHGVNAQIYFQVGSKTWKNKPQTYQEAKDKLKWLNDKKSKDICYIVNSGGTTNSSIITINAVFLDWDCGKDAEGNYFDVETVKKKKALFMPQLHEFALIPSFIVETRNGFQVYWLVLPETTKEQFIDIQQRIAYYFKGDPAIYNPCRVMRLPDYNWVKPTKNCEPFLVTIILYNPVRYSCSELFNSFPYVAEEDYQSYYKSVTGKYKNDKRVDRISAQDNSFSYYKDTRDIYLGTYLQGDDPLAPKQSVIDYLKKQNLAEYLNLETHSQITTERSLAIKCPFHEDKTPSASIRIDKDTGFYFLHCHSNICGFSGSILDIAAKQHHTDVSKAVGILIKHYKLEEPWIALQKGIFANNINKIEKICEFKEQYPDLYRVIHRIKNDLLSKLKFAQSKMQLRTLHNENLIIASLNKFHGLVSKNSEAGDIGRQDERIDRYCLLGLMRKLSNDEVSTSLLDNAYEQRHAIAAQYNRKGKAPNIMRTQFYTIPEYTHELLKEADRIARIMKECGIRLNAISRDLILQMFGEEKAKQIYPQIMTNAISKSGKTFIPEIESILLAELNTKGFCTVSYIIETLQAKGLWKAITERRVKKYIPALLTKLGLEERTSNKELKQSLSITAKGFPKLIIKKTIVESAKCYSPVVRVFEAMPSGRHYKVVCRYSMFKAHGLGEVLGFPIAA